MATAGIGRQRTVSFRVSEAQKVTFWVDRLFELSLQISARARPSQPEQHHELGSLLARDGQKS